MNTHPRRYTVTHLFRTTDGEVAVEEVQHFERFKPARERWAERLNELRRERPAGYVEMRDLRLADPPERVTDTRILRFAKGEA